MLNLLIWFTFILIYLNFCIDSIRFMLTSNMDQKDFSYLNFDPPNFESGPLVKKLAVLLVSKQELNEKAKKRDREWLESLVPRHPLSGYTPTDCDPHSKPPTGGSGVPQKGKQQYYGI